MRRSAHREVTEPDVVQALRDLGDKAFVMAYDSALGGKRWRITELGKSALKEEGL